MAETALALDHVTFAYPDGTRALDRLTLSVQATRSIGIIGPNGAGKTTLFGLASGLLSPSSGSVRVFGRTHGDENGVQREIGYVFQETDDQLFCPTVFEDVAFGPTNFGVAKADIAERVRDSLRRVDLAGYEERVPHHLSSGERRRVAIATVLSYGPRLLLLDEPTSDLDPRGKSDLARLLLAMNSATRIIASHDLEFVLLTCDDIVLIEKGRLCAAGLASQILANEALLAEHGLDPPIGLRGRSAVELDALRERARS